MTPKKYISKWMLFTSFAIALLALVASITGLLANFPYALETENWRLQAWGQDIGNIVAAIVLMISILMARKGSVKAYLVWLGTLFYFLYAYIIYTVGVHFNSLFLVYVGVLGLTLYTTIFALGRGIIGINLLKFRKFASYTLIGMGVLFGILWLSEIIPATLSDTVPQSLRDAGLWVNPVHVIDLSTVLPGFVLTGIFVLKKNSAGLFFAVPWLVFSVLMGSSIVVATIIMAVNGFDNTLPPLVMVSILVLLSLFAVTQCLKNMEVER